MPNITFRFENGDEITASAPLGANLLDTAQSMGVAIDAPCGGSGMCGKCRVRLLSGAVEAGQGRHLTQEDFDAGWRLACESKVSGDVTVAEDATLQYDRTADETTVANALSGEGTLKHTGSGTTEFTGNVAVGCESFFREKSFPLSKDAQEKGFVIRDNLELPASLLKGVDPKKVQDLPAFRRAAPKFPRIPVEEIGL